MAERKHNSIHFLADRLRALREQAQLTQEEFAEHAGIGYKDYQNIEAARRWNPLWNSVRRLAKLHGLTVRELVAEAMPITTLVWRKPVRVVRAKRGRAGR